MVEPKRRGRPPKVKPPVEPPQSVEAAPQSPSIDPNLEVRLELRNLKFRKAQWEMLDERAKQKLAMTEEEFLVSENPTGAGPTAYFTPPEDRTEKIPLRIPE